MDTKLKMRLIAMALGVAMTFSAQAAEPIKIGLSGPFTGGSSPMGISMRDAVRLAVDEINRGGGVLGRQLQLVERDDEAKNERGAQVAQELIYKEHVVASVGIINTGVMLASARFYEEAKIPVITPGPTGTEVTKMFGPPQYADNYIFRVSLPDNIQADMIAEEAVRRRGYKKVAILADSTNYGQLGRAELISALDKRGVKPVATEKFNVGDVDMTPQLLRAKDAGAQVILTYAVGPELAQIANGMTKLGWKVPMIGSHTLSMPNFIDTAGANAEGAIFPQTFVASSANQKGKDFVQNYEKTYKVERIAALGWAAPAYDTVYLLAAAIKQAGSTDGPKVKDALENLNVKVDGVLMTYDKPFSKSNHELFKNASQAFMATIANREVVKVGESK
ncbi:amino acid ABC transporter substrate-binding protein [Trinickia violacea]|uniref:Amino acid ABC transporter substrate-binding protein n=1 Tax=Trinickia violacea TaxID=2571746 RepID=A0A4P8J399_9BURK|nr:ABC transporter substrate-binding protein [Trinickia violacea]QCP54304.1 amino acid ABC transporter substrate-binding protein [Trinickia violacea]